MDSERKSFFIPGAILLAGFLIAVALFSDERKDRQADSLEKEADTQDGQAAVRLDIGQDDDAVLGDPASKVVIIEFSDFQCPQCGLFAREMKPQIIERYIETGKAKLVYRDYAFLGEESRLAAEAAECAGAQGKFWEFHDYLYAHQGAENQGNFSRSRLEEFARIVGLDPGTFFSCLESGAYAKEVARDTDEAVAAGIRTAPSFVINGQLVEGLLPLAEFEAIIEKALSTK